MTSGAQERRNVLAAGDPAAGVSVGDRVSAAADELYLAAPEEFTGRRADLAEAARAAGDRAAAAAIAALRKPTRAAWVVNRLVRANPSALAQLTELGTALRAAQQAGHGPRLRELSAARGALVDALTAQALAAAGLADQPASLGFEVTQTLTAATVDQDAAAAVAAARLTRAVQWSGFGVPQARQSQEPSVRARGPEPSVAPVVAPVVAPAATPGTARRRQAAGRATADRPAGHRQAAADERAARESAERAALHRARLERAERALADAVAATGSAEAAEDRLEFTVHDLEQRLTRARADLAAARARARHAEAAERRARQALHRLPAE